MAVASAGPYANNLHLAATTPTPHHSIFCRPDALPGAQPTVIGADFRFEVPGQSSVGLISCGRGQWLGGHHGKCGARAYRPNGGSGGLRPPEAESILVIGCPTEPANLAPSVKFSK